MHIIVPLEVMRRRASDLANEIALAAQKPDVKESFDLMLQLTVELADWLNRYEAEQVAPAFLPAYNALIGLLERLETRLETEGEPKSREYMQGVIAAIKAELAEEFRVDPDQGVVVRDRSLS